MTSGHRLSGAFMEVIDQALAGKLDRTNNQSCLHLPSGTARDQHRGQRSDDTPRDPLEDAPYM